MGAATIAPSHLKVTNPAPSAPEIVFAFKALGDLESTETAPVEADLSKPIHMRGRSTEKPHRSPVTLRIGIDGHQEEIVFTARGVSSDGPAIGEWRKFVEEGPHTVTVELITGKDAHPIGWSGIIEAQPRNLHVITYNPKDGFRVE